MECKTCGKENDSSAKFCGVCGTQLIEDSIDFDPQNIGSENPMIGFGAAIQLGFKNYVNFGGRATRAEYWWWFLFAILGGVVTGIIDAFGIGVTQSIFNLAIFIPGLALGARRLHDIGKSGWWQLLWFVILIGWIILIIWCSKQGNRGPNSHGPDPRTAPPMTQK